MIRLLVCGGRNFNDKELLDSKLTHIHQQQKISLIIEGGSKGADTLARKFGENNNIPVQTFPANWGKHGKSAGPIRNKQMLVEGKPDLIVAFPGGLGTENMIKQAKIYGIKVIEVNNETV